MRSIESNENLGFIKVTIVNYDIRLDDVDDDEDEHVHTFVELDKRNKTSRTTYGSH